MKICYVINHIDVEKCGTTITLMKKMYDRGHNVYVMNVGDFCLKSNFTMSVHTIHFPKKLKVDSDEAFLEKMQSGDLKKSTVDVSEFDVMFIRNNPTEEGKERHWAEKAGISFGRIVEQMGVLVLNDAYAMTNSFVDKLYFEEFPEEIKPDSIVTREKEELMKFYKDHKNQMVLKPLEGSGGQNVYFIDKNEKNTNQIIDTILAEGYVIAQQYLPDVSKGDVRILLMNGRVLEQDGEKALVLRKSMEGEFRNNLTQGGSAGKAAFTPEMEHIVNVVSPKLIRDGHFFVGLDVVGDKLIEINVLSPGGLRSFPKIGLPDFAESVVDAIERKVEYKKIYKGQLSNKVLATMH